MNRYVIIRSDTKSISPPMSKQEAIKKIKQYDKIIQQTCLEKEIEYLYLYDLLNDDELSDGLHPNEIGHQKMCDVIKNKIDQMI